MQADEENRKGRGIARALLGARSDRARACTSHGARRASDSARAQVALKKIRILSETQGLPLSLVREIKILKKLKHERMVQLNEIVTQWDPDSADPGAGELFLAMEVRDARSHERARDAAPAFARERGACFRATALRASPSRALRAVRRPRPLGLARRAARLLDRGDQVDPQAAARGAADVLARGARRAFRASRVLSRADGRRCSRTSTVTILCIATSSARTCC